MTLPQVDGAVPEVPGGHRLDHPSAGTFCGASLRNAIVGAQDGRPLR
jgi:hypothetical protein